MRQLSDDEMLHLRRMLDGGFPQKSCATRFGLTRSEMHRLIHNLGLARVPKPRERRPNDFKLSDQPLGDWYSLHVGEDRYLERLREVHGDREGQDP